MDVPLVSTAPTGAAAIITPIAATRLQAAGQTQAAAALLAQTTVDLSPLGRFLSAVTLFQKRMLGLQANSVAGAGQPDPEAAIAAVASSVAALSDSANDLQASLITGTSDDQSMGTLFSQQFAAQTGGTDDSASLGAIGLTFTSGLGQPDVLNVDTAVLKAAFEADPAGTAALLGRTAAAFGALTGVAAEAGVDPTALLAEDGGADIGLQAPAGNPAAQNIQETQVTQGAQTTQATQDSRATQNPQALPGFADPAPTLSTDGAFLQELLADTQRPGLALTQAPPPAVAEANANFAAERAAEADAAGGLRSGPDSAAAPLPPPLPEAASNAAAAALANRAQASSSGAPELPLSASQAALNATAGTGVPRSAPSGADNPDPLPLPASAQAAAAQAARTLADKGAANNIVLRDANNRLADTMDAEREASERIASAVAAGRAAQVSQRETQDLDEAAMMRATDNAAEHRRVEEQGTQVRLERSAQSRQGEAGEAEVGAPQRDRVTATLVQPLPVANVEEDGIALPLAQPLPVNNAQQLARDPATAAAIAAYNLNAGPFAALNGRPEIAAQRPKVVAPVDSVTSVAAIETDAATSDNARPFR